MPDAGALCLACGLCCDGSLFAHASVGPDEAEALTVRGLPVVRRDEDKAHLCQPCRALDGTRCTIYEARPGTCREYDCDLVNALRGGELDLAEALEVVERTRSMRAELVALLPPESGDPEPLRQRVCTAHQPPMGGPLPRATWSRFHALEDALDHSFRGRRGR
jgi:Fe-S-cluster containining protein